MVNVGDIRDAGSVPGLGGSRTWKRAWKPTPIFSPGEFHGQRSLAGCNPWGRKELGTTERLSRAEDKSKHYAARP